MTENYWIYRNDAGRLSWWDTPPEYDRPYRLPTRLERRLIDAIVAVDRAGFMPPKEIGDALKMSMEANPPPERAT